MSRFIIEWNITYTKELIISSVYIYTYVVLNFDTILKQFYFNPKILQIMFYKNSTRKTLHSHPKSLFGLLKIIFLEIFLLDVWIPGVILNGFLVRHMFCCLVIPHEPWPATMGITWVTFNTRKCVTPKIPLFCQKIKL